MASTCATSRALFAPTLPAVGIAALGSNLPRSSSIYGARLESADAEALAVLRALAAPIRGALAERAMVLAFENVV